MTVDISSKRPRVASFSCRFYGRRFAFFFLLALCLAFTTSAKGQQKSRNAGPPWADSTGESDVYPVGDAVGVYRAVLDLLYVDGRDHPGYSVRCPPKSPTKSVMAAILEKTRGIDSTMNVQVTYAECAQQ